MHSSVRTKWEVNPLWIIVTLNNRSWNNYRRTRSRLNGFDSLPQLAKHSIESMVDGTSRKGLISLLMDDEYKSALTYSKFDSVSMRREVTQNWATLRSIKRSLETSGLTKKIRIDRNDSQKFHELYAQVSGLHVRRAGRKTGRLGKSLYLHDLTKGHVVPAR
jgi:hypothetical protein